MKVSIIIPVYNAGRFLENALHSISGQTLTDFECVCVDDGSTDNSSDIINGFAKDDPRFKLIRQPNSGPAAARNHGIDVSSGEYVCCVDADDVLPPDALAVLVSLADSSQADVTWGQHRRFTGNGAFGKCGLSAGCKVFSGGEWQNWFNGRFAQEKTDDPYYGIPVVPWNKMIRRTSLGTLRFPENRDVIGGEDIMFCAMLLPRMNTVAVSAAVTYGYRTVESSLNNSRSPVWLSRYSKAYVEVAKILRDRPLAVRNFARSALRPGFIRQALDAFVLTNRAKTESESDQELRRAFSRLAKAYCAAADAKMVFWLRLGGYGCFSLLAFLYRRSSLYRKSRGWSE